MHRHLATSALACAQLFAFVAPSRAADDETLIADFEGDSYDAWTVEGEAFGTAPARGTLSRQMPVSGFEGQGLVNTYVNGDGTTGTLTSPEFTIRGPFLNFLIGGGNHPEETCVNLLVDGKVVRTATGSDNEALDWHTWDVAALNGKAARIQILDRHTGGWGHLNVDHILLSDRRRQSAPAQKEMVIERRYLHLPVKNGAPKRRMSFVVDGKTEREFEIELAGEDDADFHVFSDVFDYRGRTIVIQIDRLPESSRALAAITQSDKLSDANELYRERLRPQFHFTARRGWLNDPNGLVHLDGEYHLYFQHNPYGWAWGNMHWGHAVSTDLVHWKELPIALYPQRFGDWCFSGSAVVDRRNTAGFKTGAEEVLVVAYTSTGRGECIAYSTDRGRTFHEYAGNPVVRHTGRDPKVFWYEPGAHWVMAVYDEHEGQQWIAFYTSPDLKQWEFQSRIAGYFECPEIFELPVNGGRRRCWVLYAADGEYAIGTFDGKAFTPESGKHRFNWGNCFYASQTFNDVPERDGRRIQIAWGRVNHPGMPFNQMMNFPVELTLRTTDEGVRMFAAPVREIERLHGQRHRFENRTLREGEDLLKGVTGDLFHIRAAVIPETTARFSLIMRGVPVEYDAATGRLSCRDQSVELRTAEERRIDLEILVDRSSVEIFASGGRYYLPIGVIPDDADRTLSVVTSGGTTRVDRLEVFELKSAWSE